MQVRPDFQKLNEFTHAQYYHASGIVPLGQIFNLTVTGGMSRKKFYFGILPKLRDNLNFTKAPKPALDDAHKITPESGTPWFWYSSPSTGALGALCKATRPPNNKEDFSAYIKAMTGDSGVNNFQWASTFSSQMEVSPFSNFHNGFKAAPNYASKFYARLSLKGSTVLEIPLSCATTSFYNGYASDNSGFGVSYWGQSEGTCKDTIRVCKRMTIDGTLDDYAMLLNPFEILCDIDEIQLNSLAPLNTGLNFFLYLGIMADIAT